MYEPKEKKSPGSDQQNTCLIVLLESSQDHIIGWWASFHTMR